MALFDYKFIILIGLTLVIYFIYKEIETLKIKIDKIENDFKDKDPVIVETTVEKIKDRINKIENNILLLKSNNDITKIITPPPPNSVISNSSSPKKNNIIIDFTQTQNTNKSPRCNILLEENKTSLENKVVINISDNKNTVIESLSDNKNTIIESLSDNINTVIESLSDNEESSSESDEIEPLAIYSNDNENFDETQNSLIESVKNLSVNNENVQLEFHYDISINNSSKTIINDEPLTNDILQGMKLPEIKKIAEENNIILTKKVGNNTKPKIKKELIDEILNKNNNIK